MNNPVFGMTRYDRLKTEHKHVMGGSASVYVTWGKIRRIGPKGEPIASHDAYAPHRGGSSTLRGLRLARTRK